jgi:methionine synthase I (cobalamin-dependent)/5,10-methylenetetrahydrofolate reductase
VSHPLFDRLAAGPLLVDGAMGTMLYAAGASLDDAFDLLSITQPDLVMGVHRAYLDAGADIIETNTFGANRLKLEPFGAADRVREINRKSVRLARESREISGRAALIAGSIGPLGRTMAPFGTLEPAVARRVFREQVDALLEGGVDLFLIETIGNLSEMEQAILAVQEASDLPIIASMTFAEDGQTIGGSTPEQVVERLREMNVAVVGANCSVGPQRLLPVVESMVHFLEGENCTTLPVSCMPNAGWPAHVAGRVIYPSSAEYFAEFARRAADAGVRIIGGCCGTTPAHTAAMREALDAWSASHGLPCAQSGSSTRSEKTRRKVVPVDVDLVAPEGPTRLQEKLARGEFAVSVEIDPPKGLNPAKALEGARLLQAAGVDLINVADSPMARVRMSALTLCYLIQHQVGVETILHLTTRDRSLMGLQSELLGAHAVGVRNILALTGDPPSLGDYPESSAVYDVDSVGLIRVLGRLNAGQDSAGASIGRPAGFAIACAVDPTRQDLALEAERLRAKIGAGAQVVMTQPIFNPETWWRFLEVFGADRLPVPVMAGILPLQSTRHAEFLHNEVPGITLTDEARERMRLAGPEGRREGVLMAQELLAALQPHVQGVYLMPSFGRYEVAAEVLQVLQREPAGVASAD